MEGVQVSPTVHNPLSLWERAGVRVITLATTALLATACGDGPRVEGSVGELVDLGYQSVEARLSEEELTVRFLTQQGTGENTILKVAARMEGLAFTAGAPIDLAETLANGAQRGSVSRSVLDEPSRNFPTIARGSLLLSGVPETGRKVAGEFNVTFANGTDVYSGRTVFGRFEATVP